MSIVIGQNRELSQILKLVAVRDVMIRTVKKEARSEKQHGNGPAVMVTSPIPVISKIPKLGCPFARATQSTSKFVDVPISVS